MKGNLAEVLPERELELGAVLSDRPHGDYEHWHFHESEARLVWLVLDKAGARANTLDEDVFAELERVLAEIETNRPRALVIRSAKPAGFAAGADLHMLEQMKDEAGARQRLEAAAELLARIEALPFATIAVVHGHCLGGGLELALACNYRIARADATFGFPEVRLGLHPGLGGTVRLTQQISPTEALKLMLTGRTIDARRALRLGLADAVCEERHVARAVRMAAEGALQRRSGSHAKAKFMSILPSRTLIARRLESETAKRVRREHYPAPFALIDLWREHGDDRGAMFAAERASFARMLFTPSAKNLLRVFFLREHLRSLGARSERVIRHVHVIGAGAMGGDIAAWCALHGRSVTVQDRDPAMLAGASQRAARLFEEKLAGAARQAAWDRFTPDFAGAGVPRADLVIEAVPERLDIKRAVYAEVEPRMKGDALLATNTSSIRLEELCAGLALPERFFGLHFFNPVARMELVEIVEHARCAPAVLAAARAFVTGIERLPAPVRSAPGFLVNRALVPYLLEAVTVLDQGVSADEIDAAATAFGMPMGPIELADRVGLDVCVKVAEVLKRELERPLPEIPDWLRERVTEGALGAKTGRGILEYDERGKALRKESSPAVRPELADRLLLPLLDACVACLREGVVADERTLDGAMIFATGFAPFRGGPLHWARLRGIGEIVAQLEALAREHGPRFTPDPGWDRLR